MPTEAELDAADRVRAAAHATPLPGPLLGAFAQPPVRAAGLDLAPITAGHFVVLQMIEAPFIRKLKALAEWQAERAVYPDSPPVEPTITAGPEEIFEQLYVLTRSARDSRAALAAGRQKFRELALEATADRLPPRMDLLRDLVEAMENHLIASLGTHVPYEPPPGDNGEGAVFTSPPAAQPTASGGGSTTSAT